MKTQYTCTLKQYIEEFHFDLPTIFDNVPLLDGTSFKELFISKFLTNEIGFETPDLFNAKLELKAKLVCPSYINKINWYQNNIATLVEQLAGTTDQDTGIDKVTNKSENQNAVRNYVIENPTGSQYPIHNTEEITMTDEQREMISGVNENGGKNKGESENVTEYGKKHERTELTTAHIDYLMKGLPNLYSDLLNEFETLFITLRGNKTWLW